MDTLHIVLTCAEYYSKSQGHSKEPKKPCHHMELKFKVGETNEKREASIYKSLVVMTVLQNKAGYMDWVWRIRFGGGCSGRV